MGDEKKRGPVESRPTSKLAAIELEALINHGVRARRPSDLEALIEVVGEDAAAPAMPPKMAAGTQKLVSTLRRTPVAGVTIIDIRTPSAPIAAEPAPAPPAIEPPRAEPQLVVTFQRRSHRMRDIAIGVAIGLVALTGVWLVAG